MYFKRERPISLQQFKLILNSVWNNKLVDNTTDMVGATIIEN